MRGQQKTNDNRDDKVGDYRECFSYSRDIEAFENLFLRGKEGEVYRFLMDAIEKPLIESVLAKTEGNQLRAAKILGINRNTLHKKIMRLKIDVKFFKAS